MKELLIEYVVYVTVMAAASHMVATYTVAHL